MSFRPFARVAVITCCLAALPVFGQSNQSSQEPTSRNGLSIRVFDIRIAGPAKNQNGQGLWPTEDSYTLNAIPKKVAVFESEPSDESKKKIDDTTNVVNAAEAKDGFVALFDGRSLTGWRGYGKREVPDGWTIDDASIHRSGGGGDLITTGEYGSFDLRMQWRISPGGNSGVIYHVAETNGPPYHTGIEMQVLDNTKHNDGKNPLTSAGSCYAMFSPVKDVTKPVGEWNDARLVVDGKKVTHYLNGTKIVEYEIDSPEWKETLANSKFKGWPRFAREPVGYICLQDHGDPVWFRNIRIKKLDQ